MKKKTSVYFLIPVIGVALFGVGYWRFTSNDDLKEKQRIELRRKERDEKQIATNKKNEEASNIAMKKTEERRKAKDAKDKKTSEDKQALLDASSAKVRAEQKAQSLVNDLRSIEQEVKDAKEAFDTVEQKKKSAQADALFFTEYAKTVRANHEAVKETHRKVEEAEKAKFEAEKARLAAEQAAAAKR